MEVLSRKLVVVLERDPGTELRVKAVLTQGEEQGRSTSPNGNGNFSVPCFLCGQSVGRGQGSGDSPFRDAVAEVFARSVEEFSERGRGALEDCWRGESCPSCFALMEGVWTLQGKIEGLRGEVKALVERAVGLRGSGALEGSSEEETENHGREKKGRRTFRPRRRTRQVQSSTLKKKKGNTDGNSNTRPVFAKGSSNPQENNPPVYKAKSSQNLQSERPDHRPSDEKGPGAVGPPSPGGTNRVAVGVQSKKKRKQGRIRPSCYFCQKPFRSLSALEEHLRTHTKEKPFPCPHCGQEFAFKNSLDRHIRYHLNEKAFKCNFCGKGFVEKGALDTHIRRHLKEKWFKCPEKGCLSSFVTSGNLKEHLRTHSGEKPFPCKYPNCGKAFSQQNTLKIHSRTHSGERPFKCNLCGKRFSQKGHRDIHIRYHLKEKAYKCNFCGKGFVEKRNLDIHIRRHLKEKWFKCSHKGCSKSFVTVADLKQHSRVHSGARRKLSKCGKTLAENTL